MAEIKDLRRDLVAKLPTGTVDLADSKHALSWIVPMCESAHAVMAAGSIRVYPLDDSSACHRHQFF